MSTVVSGSNTEERDALLGLSVPEVVVNWYQEQRRGLKIAPVQGGGIYAIGAAFIIIFMFAFSIAMAFLTKIFNKLIGNKFIRIILILSVLSIVAYLVYYYYYRPNKNVELLAAARTDFKALLENFQNADPGLDSAVASQPLLNLQPFTMKQAGYIGPTIRGGEFDLDMGLREAIKNGIRFFVLQVDYLDVKKDPKKFPEKGEPALVYRDDGGALISANGLRLTDVARNLADYGFSEEAVGSVYPLVVYLHFNRTPDPIKAPEAYVNFLSKTAAALEPLFGNHLSGTSVGQFTRQQNEMDLLRTPVRDLSKKVIYMTNVDTSLFRRAEVLGMKPFESKFDLDYLTHVRVYAETAGDMLGATTIAPTAGKAAAVLVSLKRILGMSATEKAAFAEMSKTRFVIATGTQAKNPAKKDVMTAFESLGVNVVPVLPFDSNREELKGILKMWPAGKFLRTRPPALQAATTVAPSMGGAQPPQ
jgi:hypothetical protein